MMHLQSPQQTTYDAIHEIRRSLSRSPSKAYHFRASLQNAGMPYHPSPLSPSRRSTAENLYVYQAMTSPFAPRSSQTNRVQRPVLRRTGPTFGLGKIRTSPKSPSKKTTSETYDPNSHTHFLRKRRSAEIEEDLNYLINELEDKENATSPSTESPYISWKTAQTKQEKRRSGGLLIDLAPLSPMKRADGDMNVDEVSYKSPNPKRRSLHGLPVTDYGIFGSDEVKTGEKSVHDDYDWTKSFALSPSNMSPSKRYQTIPKRSSSLRKSTLQQRQSERSPPLRMINFQELQKNWPEATPIGKKPLSMSLNEPADQRDSPFSNQGSLPNASIHPMLSTQQQVAPSTIFRHPLATTMTQSSSTSSIPDDSPTHEPPRRTDRSRSHDFSKSLPLNALRPARRVEVTDSQFSSQGSFATPAAYKAAKPLPAAFMSTGLISKKNRNADDANAGLTKAHMPDTPCKRQSIIFPPPKESFGGVNPMFRTSQASFGTPQSPADAAFGDQRVRPFPFAKNTGLFNRSKHSLTKKASFASLISIDADDKARSQSPSISCSQSTEDGYPPTPTKADALLANRLSSISPSPRHVGPAPASFLTTRKSRHGGSKLYSIQSSPDHFVGEHGNPTDDSPSAKPRQKPIPRKATRTSDAQIESCRPRRFDVSHEVVPFQNHSRTPAKTFDPLGSPSVPDIYGSSPHTPNEAVFPVDPSSLSISGKHDKQTARHSFDLFSIPATPTGPRESFANFSNRTNFNNKAPDAVDVDPSLASRFDKVDLVGTGEFSQVYRVAEHPQPQSRSRLSPRGSPPATVWAVKKSRNPYSGPKDRARKVHEVDVLKALGHNEHVLMYHDSWEDRGYLYIQTEFCEDGTLDVFLGQAGSKARLDDFRIWKILLELSLGLGHVHEMGFIHLDLKPANILITFGGVLKIADFGMATRYPAKAGIEGEGDREYIGPEILMGKYDKPADVFALGLIMLETAGNVELPDNGTSWQKLRNGDMSDVPSLTWSSASTNILRDSSGIPMEDDEAQDVHVVHSCEHDLVEESEATKASHMIRRGELVNPPAFMTDALNTGALDCLVRWMISPDPEKRPVIQQVLESEGVQWVQSRRRAGATIFEGNWGPADDILLEDAEMIDV